MITTNITTMINIKIQFSLSMSSLTNSVRAIPKPKKIKENKKISKPKQVNLHKKPPDNDREKFGLKNIDD